MRTLQQSCVRYQTWWNILRPKVESVNLFRSDPELLIDKKLKRSTFLQERDLLVCNVCFPNHLERCVPKCLFLHDVSLGRCVQLSLWTTSPLDESLHGSFIPVSCFPKCWIIYLCVGPMGRFIQGMSRPRDMYHTFPTHEWKGSVVFFTSVWVWCIPTSVRV